MEKIAGTNLLVLFASLSLWTVAFQATLDGGSASASPSFIERVEGAASHALSSHADAARAGMTGEALLEDGTPIVAAASGHWF